VLSGDDRTIGCHDKLVKDSQSQIVKDSQSQLTKNNENIRLADCTKKDEKIMSFLCILLYFKKRPKTWTKNNKKA